LKSDEREKKMKAQTAETINVNTVNAASSAAEILRDEKTQSFYEIDVLSQFRANLNQLEELNSRLHFMMNEVGGLVKKR